MNGHDPRGEAQAEAHALLLRRGRIFSAALAVLHGLAFVKASSIALALGRPEWSDPLQLLSGLCAAVAIGYCLTAHRDLRSVEAALRLIRMRPSPRSDS